MKFIVSSGQLMRSLQTVSGVIQTNNTLPILDHFLVHLSPGKLTITASDLETTMTTEVSVDSSEEISAAVPAKMLLDTVKSFPEQPLTFTLNSSSNLLEVSSDFGKYSLGYLDATEYPKPPSLENAESIIISEATLSSAISKTLFAAGNDDLRPVMSGVFFQFTSEGLTFVATDAHKLVRYIRKDIIAPSTAEFILPKKPLNLLKNTIGNSKKDVKITYTDQNATFEYGEVTLTCRLIDGKYPNFQAVIPQDNPNHLVADRSALLSSVKRISIFSNKTTHQVKLKIAGNELNISAEDLDFSNKASERLTCNYTGTDIEIGFNSRFLVEMLNNLESEEVIIELSAPNRAGIILPDGGLEEGEEVLMLVMPVMLNS
ncbi:MAG: DNA polymerase III subunit beta [Schleiferiaceae bacterium]|jgi:DNA polymerase-3 subunit beta|tara:strand:+ start:49022 stop:50143 length:1122 start_codon:yes stop_codon:yes gene_type:complete